MAIPLDEPAVLQYAALSFGIADGLILDAGRKRVIEEVEEAA